MYEPLISPIALVIAASRAASAVRAVPRIVRPTYGVATCRAICSACS
jgi:hypothetical protein